MMGSYTNFDAVVETDVETDALTGADAGPDALTGADADPDALTDALTDADLDAGVDVGTGAIKVKRQMCDRGAIIHDERGLWLFFLPHHFLTRRTNSRA